MFKKLKKKIKLAKVWVVIFSVIFLALIVNSICLTYKVIQLEKQNNIQSEYTNNDKTQCGNHN